MLTGHEGRYLTIIGGTVLMRAVGFFILIPLFGISGAVAATAISFIALALLMRSASIKLAGIGRAVLQGIVRRAASQSDAPHGVGPGAQAHLRTPLCQRHQMRHQAIRPGGLSAEL